MKFCLLLTVALVATLYSAELVAAREVCSQVSCLSPDKCEEEVVGGLCQEQGTSCCSVVKPEYKTHCHHFGGVCMDRCHQNLQQAAVDCPSNQICCTLV